MPQSSMRVGHRPVGRLAALTGLAALLTTLTLTPASASAADGSVVAATPTAGSGQVVTVAATAGSTYATVTAWQRQANGLWTRVVGPIPARVGQNGIGPAREGSQYTPAGTFALDQAFGRLANPGSKVPYFRTDHFDWWDENPSSATYNLHIRRSTSPGGASENLYTAGTSYNLAVNMAYNPTRIPGNGSAFFLHVGTGSPTAGCVSIDQSSLTKIIRWLDPAQHPVIDVRTGAAWVPRSPTTLTQATFSRTVDLGRSTSLTGTLVSASGTRLGGMTTQIWGRAHGGVNWAHIGDARTSGGSYSWTFAPSGAKDYQVRWPGTSTLLGSSSRITLIRTR